MADVLPSDELIEEPSDYGSLKPGERLGRYELLVPIARGGMARVWAARLHGQRGFQKLVAIKTILPHLADEPEFERMFLDEARIASGVHHPNVCEIYELGEERKTLYLAMEWVSGDSLARVIRASGKTEALEARVVARIIADACAGLHAAHELTDDDGRELAVVHRDLSPHNILLTADGTTKVADFGVAKALGQLHEATSAGQLKGKIAYMAPEQVTGAGVDRRSDVFSLGCVLYEATTGQRPFRGEGDHQVMHALLKGEFPAPSSIVRGYPQELERIVTRALSPQPILRFPTAERMRFALEEFVAKGQLVTQSNVGQVVRARIGEPIERRKERIRQASSAVEREGGWSEPPGGMTPSNANQEHGGHRSGVKPSGQHAASKPFSTLQIERPPPSMSLAPETPQTFGMQPTSSTTIPHAPTFSQSGQTPVSHPGASHSSGHGQGAGPMPSHGPHAYAPGAHDAMPFGQPGLMPPVVANNPGDVGFSRTPPPQPMPPFTAPPPSSVPHLMHAGTPMVPSAASSQPPLGQITFPPGSSPLGAASSMPQGGPSVPFDGPAPAADGPASAQGGIGYYAVAIGVGVLLAALIGVGGFFAWRGRLHAAPTTSTTSKPMPLVAAPVEGPTSPKGVPAAGGATPPVATVAAVSPEIAFKVSPPDAILVVDGKELAGDARSVARPAVGKTVNVIVRAKGFDDVTIQIDFFTTSPMDLTLKPAGSSVRPGGEPSAGPVADEPRTDKDPPKPKRPPQKGDSLPANPY